MSKRFLSFLFSYIDILYFVFLNYCLSSYRFFPQTCLSLFEQRPLKDGHPSPVTLRLYGLNKTFPYYKFVKYEYVGEGEMLLERVKEGRKVTCAGVTLRNRGTTNG